MQTALEQTFMRTLRLLYDTENQLEQSLGAIETEGLARELAATIGEIEDQSREQAKRLEEVFRVLDQQPRGEASWVATALIREAWQATASRGASRDDAASATEPCAASLLALKRYELTLYELLLRWSESCHLVEVLPHLRRSIAEELVVAACLSQLAFDLRRPHMPPLAVGAPDARALGCA